MYASAKTLRAQEPRSWTWNLVPLLIVTVAMTGFFLPYGSTDADLATAAAASQEAPSPAFVLVPSPQPGIGEPGLRVEDQLQSY